MSAESSRSELRLLLTAADGTSVAAPHTFCGQGRAVYADGASYEGAFVWGRREGFGVYVHPSGDKYEGFFKEGKKHGRGKITFRNGGFFHGDFVCGLREGEGTRRFANGDFYFGKFKNGLYHGRGTYTFGQTKQKLKGEWVEGHMVEGEWLWQDGTKYKGTFCCSKPQGEGSWSFPAGTEVAGVYVQRVVPVEPAAAAAAAAAAGEEDPPPLPVKKQQVFLSWHTEQVRPITQN